MDDRMPHSTAFFKYTYFLREIIVSYLRGENGISLSVKAFLYVCIILSFSKMR